MARERSAKRSANCSASASDERQACRALSAVICRVLASVRATAADDRTAPMSSFSSKPSERKIASRCNPSSLSRAANSDVRSRSDSAIREYNSVPNRFCRIACRSLDSAVNNLRNCPCGNTMTWRNCSTVSPVRRAISALASFTLRATSTTSAPPSRRYSSAMAACLVVPSPR